MINNCLVCNKSFNTKPHIVKGGGGKFCSRSCYGVWYSDTKNPLKQCNYCGKDYKGRIKSKYCSVECSNLGRQKRKIVSCGNCGKDFSIRLSKIKDVNFCSIQCAGKKKKTKPKTGQMVNCSNCGKKVYRSISNLFKRNNKNEKKEYFYCSQKCMKGMDYGGQENRVCEMCGKEYRTFNGYVKYRTSKYCSKACYTKAQKGKGNNSWKGGSSYKKFLWRVFSKYIRQRDDGVCISCGKKKHWKEMDAGHYIPKTLGGMNLYFDERNVNCQCVYCNRYLHGNLSKYALALQRKYGNNILEEFDKMRDDKVKISIPEYQRKIDYYKSKLKENSWDV